MSDRLLIAELTPTASTVATNLSLRRGLFLPVVLACGAFLLLYSRSLVGPVIFYDDFQILTAS